MIKQILLKFLFLILFFTASTSLSATIDWVGNMFPASGSSSDIIEGNNFTIYIQAFKSGTTEPAGQGAGISCEIYYGEVLGFGMAWQSTFTQAMTYNTDIGNNDEYQGVISPPAGLYEFTCRCSDDGGATYTWASLGSGNGQLTVNTLLPIELTSFEGEALSDLVLLDWKTSSEQNNSHFEIQRSVDGNDWKAIGEEEGAVFSSEVRSYSFRDLSPVDGENYYRLKQFDMDGSFSFSEVIMIKYKTESSVISVFPNPVSENLSIRNINFRANQIQLLDMTGRLVLFKSIQNEEQTEMDFSKIKEGIYLLRFVDQSGNTIESQRVIKR